jgi:dihydroorotate dehydrogenase electron transfer subunit
MRCKILKNKRISNNYFLLSLDLTEIAELPIPGQFYSVRCGETKDPLLRRPFGMHRLVRGRESVQLEILYQVAGKGTEWLSLRKKGECLDTIGPFGNGFIIDESAVNAVLVARGIGIAPLYAVGEAFHERKKTTNIFFLMGARIKERIFFEEQCKGIGEVFI